MNAQQRRANSFQQLTSERDKYKNAFLELVDAHYGTSYHHIGDGDGIEIERANELRKLISESQ